MKIDKIAKYKEELLNCFKSKSLIPVVGSGISCGAKARTGKVPSGGEFKQFMIDSIIESMSATEEEKKHIMSMPFSQVCELYEDDSNIVLNKSREYLKNNFQNVIINDYRKKFFEIEWPYVYTLNIDDAIEQNSQYKYVISSNREVNEEIYNENKCVIKLHGDIKEILTYSDSDCRIFSSKEYAVSLTKKRVTIK